MGVGSAGGWGGVGLGAASGWRLHSHKASKQLCSLGHREQPPLPACAPGGLPRCAGRLLPTWRGWPGTARTNGRRHAGGRQQRRSPGLAEDPANHGQPPQRHPLAVPAPAAQPQRPPHASTACQLRQPHLSEQVGVLLARRLRRLQPLHRRSLGGGLEMHGHLRGAGRGGSGSVRGKLGRMGCPVKGDLATNGRAATFPTHNTRIRRALH